MKNYLLFGTVICFMSFLFSCKKDEKIEAVTPMTNVTLHFNYTFAGKPLPLDTTNYFTKAGDTFAISEFTHYISNFCFVKNASDSFNSTIYHLSYAAYPQTNTIHFQVPKTTYKSISFLLGIDSLRNHTGEQNADLSPSKGMFWTWATGYIFLRLKAQTPSGKNIGIDMGGDNSLVAYKLDLNGFNTNQEQLTIELDVDINEMFESPYLYSLSKESGSIHDPNNSSLVSLKANMFNMVKLRSIQ